MYRCGCVDVTALITEIHDTVASNEKKQVSERASERVNEHSNYTTDIESNKMRAPVPGWPWWQRRNLMIGTFGGGLLGFYLQYKIMNGQLLSQHYVKPREMVVDDRLANHQADAVGREEDAKSKLAQKSG